MSKEKENCTLSNAELIERCNDWVSKLANSGGKAWSLQVPVNYNRDPDMLFIEMGKRLLNAEEGKKEYAKACLAKAAENVKTGVYEGCGYEKFIKESITSDDNLI